MRQQRKTDQKTDTIPTNTMAESFAKNNGNELLDHIRQQRKNALNFIFNEGGVIEQTIQLINENATPKPPADLIQRVMTFVEDGIAEKKFEPEEVDLHLYSMLQRLGEKSAAPSIQFFYSTAIENESKKQSHQTGRALERILQGLNQCVNFSSLEEYSSEKIKEAFKNKNITFKKKSSAFKLLQDAGCVFGLQFFTLRGLNINDASILIQQYFTHKLSNARERAVFSTVNYLLKETSEPSKRNALMRVGFLFTAHRPNPIPAAQLSYSQNELRMIAEDMKQEKSVSDFPPYEECSKKAIDEGHPLACLNAMAATKSTENFNLLAEIVLTNLPNASFYHLEPLVISDELAGRVCQSKLLDLESKDYILCRLIQYHTEKENLNCLYGLLFTSHHLVEIHDALLHDSNRVNIYFEMLPCLCKIFDIAGEGTINLNHLPVFVHYSQKLLESLDEKEKKFALKEPLADNKATTYKKAFPEIAFNLAAYHLGYFGGAVNQEKANQWLYFFVKFPGAIEHLKSLYEAAVPTAINILHRIQTLPNIPLSIQEELLQVSRPPEAIKAIQDPTERLNERFNNIFSMLNTTPQFTLHDQSKIAYAAMERMLEIKIAIENKEWPDALTKIEKEITLNSSAKKETRPEKEKEVKEKSKVPQRTIVSVLQEIKKDVEELKKSHAPKKQSHLTRGY